MEYKIEQAKPKYLKDIQRLNKLLFDKEIIDFDESLNPNWTLSEIGTRYFKDVVSKQDYCALVALIGDEVVGYLAGEIVSQPIAWRIIKRQAELSSMFVLSEYRNKKIGSGLIKAFFDWVRKKGIKNIKVTASAENQKAIIFYRKYGFQDYDLTLEINL